MSDIILEMTDRISSLGFIKEKVFPTDPDYVIAVGYAYSPCRCVKFANQRELLAPYPGQAWGDQTVYAPSNAPFSTWRQHKFFLLTVSDAWATCALIKTFLGSGDLIVACRIEGGIMAFYDSTACAPNWTGPTDKPPSSGAYNGNPPPSSGWIVPGPGGNYYPAPDYLQTAFGALQGIDPELTTYVVNALADPVGLAAIRQNPGGFVDQISRTLEQPITEAMRARFIQVVEARGAEWATISERILNR